MGRREKTLKNFGDAYLGVWFGFPVTSGTLFGTLVRWRVEEGRVEGSIMTGIELRVSGPGLSIDRQW